MKQYTGMRKGISLVEMIIAIILFAALATISLKYTKNYLDTDITAKKARVAAATDQANQLLQAYQIYRTEMGTDPADINDLNGSAKILLSTPARVEEMSSTGWHFAPDYNGSGLPAFYMTIDLNGSMDTASQAKSGKEYCAIFNREFNTSTELNVTAATNFGTLGDANASKVTDFARNQFCYSQDANTTIITVFVP
jgi:type II secretory pathway pseudopilin PulG